jgi:hypothetical protein
MQTREDLTETLRAPTGAATAAARDYGQMASGAGTPWPALTGLSRSKSSENTAPERHSVPIGSTHAYPDNDYLYDRLARLLP